MTAAVAIRAPRAEPLLYCSFEVHKLRSLQFFDAVPELIGCFGDDHAAAVEAGTQEVGHKGAFYIRATNHMTGKTVLSFYEVKQSGPPILAKAASDMAHFKQVRRLKAVWRWDLAAEALQQGESK